MGLLDQINEVLNVTPRRYWGEKANRLGSLLGDAASSGAQAYGSANGPLAPEHASTLGGLLMDFSPLGDAKSAYDGVQSAREGDYLGAGLGALGALPMVPNLAGMFIGKGAKTWDAVNASRAMDMEKSGIDPRKIWSETGNWKGPDGAWRQEIPDNEAFYRGSKAAESSFVSDIFPHPELSRAYPKFDGTRVTESPHPGGQFDEITGNITVGPTDANSTMLHELQHAIQQREGWQGGGAPSHFYDPAFERNAISYLKKLAKESNSDGWNEIIKNKQTLIKGGIPFSGDRNDGYKRLAGEAEARATEARGPLSLSQRRGVFPEDSYDVPLADLIFRK